MSNSLLQFILLKDIRQKNLQIKCKTVIYEEILRNGRMKKCQLGLIYTRQDGFREETQFEKVEVFIKKKSNSCWTEQVIPYKILQKSSIPLGNIIKFMETIILTVKQPKCPERPNYFKKNFTIRRSERRDKCCHM